MKVIKYFNRLTPDMNKKKYVIFVLFINEKSISYYKQPKEFTKEKHIIDINHVFVFLFFS